MQIISTNKNKTDLLRQTNTNQLNIYRVSFISYFFILLSLFYFLLKQKYLILFIY